MNNKKLMIVDDSPAIHIIIEKAAKAHGFEVCAHARNGDEAVKQFETVKPDIITMDITMPVKDGLVASREILEKCQTVKILMLSAMGDEQIMNEAKEIGISHFMRKPFKGEDVIDAIHTMLK